MNFTSTQVISKKCLVHIVNNNFIYIIVIIIINIPEKWLSALKFLHLSSISYTCSTQGHRNLFSVEFSSLLHIYYLEALINQFFQIPNDTKISNIQFIISNAATYLYINLLTNTITRAYKSRRCHSYLGMQAAFLPIARAHPQLFKSFSLRTAHCASRSLISFSAILVRQLLLVNHL